MELTTKFRVESNPVALSFSLGKRNPNLKKVRSPSRRNRNQNYPRLLASVALLLKPAKCWQNGMGAEREREIIAVLVLQLLFSQLL